MKAYFYFILIFIALSSCSKNNTPTPEPPKPVDPVIVVTTHTVTSFTPASAEIGQEVTINGTNFGSDASKVSIVFSNGISITPKSVTPNQIVFVVPANGISGLLSVVIGQATIKTATSFTWTDPKAYVVKSIGIGRVMVSVDDDYKLFVAELYGSGNRVILKRGVGNKMAFTGASINSILPDKFYPDGYLPYLEKPIDNGNQSIDTSGVYSTVIKLKGFDKAKTGYNQLNLVLHTSVYPLESYQAGFFTNYTYMKLNRKGNKNTFFGSRFVSDLFTGDINVSTVEIAPPKSANPYITRDETISYASATWSDNRNATSRVEMNSLFWLGSFGTSFEMNVGSPLKMEWVNANSGTVLKMDDWTYHLKFPNIKKGGTDEIVEPVDTVSKVFLRVTGFNAEICGYNQLRLFVTDDGYTDGIVQASYTVKPTVTPTLASIKALYNLNILYFNRGRPNFPHY